MAGQRSELEGPPARADPPGHVTGAKRCRFKIFVGAAPGVEKTYARTVVRTDGTFDDIAPRICHPGGDAGYPVFTEFGADFVDLVAAAGFEVRVHFGPPTEHDLGQVYLWKKL